MVLTSQDSGKYLTKKWHTERADAMKDKRDYTDAEEEWLEITAEPTIGLDNPDVYEVPFSPIDPNQESKGRKLDIRDDPRIG
jgi:hypothetical protein